MTGEIDVRKILASAFCKACRFLRARHGDAPARSQDSATRPPTGTRAAASFPNGFVWGTATSAYQIEGAVNEDGRGPLDLGHLQRTRPARSRITPTPTAPTITITATRKTSRLIKELGVKAYRFSIAWPRVFPDGTGAPNPKGLDFYNRLVDELLANGIEPFATLYHWDLPQALQDRVGGWQSSETSKAFGELRRLCRRAPERSRQELLHAQRSRAVREFRLWLGHRRPRSQTAGWRN